MIKLLRAHSIITARLCLLSVGWLTVGACSNKTDDIQELVGKNAAHEDKATDVTIVISEDGHIKATISAKEFIRNQKAKPPYTDMKNNLKVEFFDDSARVESTLTARYARFYEQQNNILIRDSVVVVNKKGEQLETEELVWNQKLKKCYTEKFVRITTPTQVMFGDGLEANQDFTWYQIKNIKGVFQVEKEEVPE